MELPIVDWLLESTVFLNVIIVLCFDIGKYFNANKSQRFTSPFGKGEM